MPASLPSPAVSESQVLSTKLMLEGHRLKRGLEALAERAWSTTVYSEGVPWTVRSIVAHLLSAEREFLRLFREIQAGGLGVSEDFSIDAYNADEQSALQHLSPVELLTQFMDARQDMAEHILQLSPEELALRGRHPYLGLSAIRDMIKMVYIHNQVHYRDIREAVGGGEGQL